jgi:hypothetical protein
MCFFNKDKDKKRKRTSSLVLPYIVCRVCSNRALYYCSFNCNHNICHTCLGFFVKEHQIKDKIDTKCNLCVLQNMSINN